MLHMFSQVSSTLKEFSNLMQCWLKCLVHWKSVSPSAVSRTEACGYAGRLLAMAGRLLACARRLHAGLGCVSAFSTARHTAPSTQRSVLTGKLQWWVMRNCEWLLSDLVLIQWWLSKWHNEDLLLLLLPKGLCACGQPVGSLPWTSHHW